MSKLKEQLFSNWHLMRIIRLALGIWIGIDAITMGSIFAALFSVFFLYQAITDTGCCGAQGCNTGFYRTKQHDEETAEYEEIK